MDTFHPDVLSKVRQAFPSNLQNSGRRKRLPHQSLQMLAEPRWGRRFRLPVRSSFRNSAGSSFPPARCGGAALFLPAFLPAAVAQNTAHFHHLHLNSTDPKAAIEFYTARLESERRKFAGAQDAVWANGSWLLFTKVDAAPKADITSGIWHMGWGGGDNMKETYRKQLDAGTKFQTPLTDISDQCDGKGGNERFLFAYIDAPDHALIELNTTAAGVKRFGHVHLLSNDPITAGEWYMKEFGLRPRT